MENLAGLLLRDVAILALARMDHAPPETATWSEAEATLLRREAARLLRRQADAAAFLSQHTERLVGGIELVPFLAEGGPFGPSWSAHPFASPAMDASYKLREPDVTRSLAKHMWPAAGRRGPERAVSFLRVLAELAGATDILQALDGARPSVTAEHPVQSTVRSRKGTEPARYDADGRRRRAGSLPRIDLLFEWPVGSDSRRAVIVVEAKLGASVGVGQLSPYRAEAKRIASGGPTALVLLTAKADKAERRHRMWRAVRWFALMRRWETLLAKAGDDDPEFARVRAHVWRFIFSSGGVFS